MSHYISLEKIEFYRSKLLEIRDHSVAKMAQIKFDISNTAENDVDVFDIASKVEERNFMMAEMNRQEGILRQTAKAITNFDEDFGYCVECGAEIGEARLTINPAISCCVECQTKSEYLKKTRGI